VNLGLRTHHHPEIWLLGHLTSEYEQKTQQSPDNGLIMVEQCLHSKKNKQESSGIVALDFFEQMGHEIRASIRALNVVL
jgi:hypothetical protein